MPAEIVTETCPSPECNLSTEDVERFLDELKNYMGMFKPAFQRVEQLTHSEAYLRGLLGYASRKGYSLIEGRLFMPDEWFEETHVERRSACGLPADLLYQTKPEIGLDLVQKALQRGSLPFQWVAADELYGDSPTFRDGIDALGKWYFTEIKSTTPIWRTRPKVHFPKWKGQGRQPTRLRLRNPSARPLQLKQSVRNIPKKTGCELPSRKAAKVPSSAIFLFCV